MKSRHQTPYVITGLALLVLLIPGCEAGLQDAFWSGLFDFISSQVTETLSTLSPLPEAIAGGG